MQIKQNLYKGFVKCGVKIFSGMFPEYFASEPLAPTDRYLEYSFVAKNLPRPPAKILDVGCCGSFFPLLLAGFGYDTQAMDVRPYSILNRMTFDNFKFLKGDIRKAGFPDSSFDAIIAVSTIEHIGLSGRYGMDEDPDGDRKALKEMKRMVRGGGIVLLTFPFGKAKVIRPYNKIYDGRLIREIAEDFKIDKEEYYMQDSADDWHRCSRSEAEAVDATSDRGPVCLLKIIKK